METYDTPRSLTSPIDLCAALDAAVTAAHAGAAILQSYAHHRADLVIDRKARNDLVSQADREAEAAIIDELRARTPRFGIVAEETGGQAQGAATWYIDPLDGTTNFLHDIPHYAVSIALIAHAGTAISANERLAQDMPVAGVVYDPSREELFTAVYGLGAWLNGRRISCSRTRTIEDSVLATGFLSAISPSPASTCPCCTTPSTAPAACGAWARRRSTWPGPPAAATTAIGKWAWRRGTWPPAP